jgi:hypothetical protein
MTRGAVLFAAAAVIGMFSFDSSASAESYRVCIGQYEHKCPTRKDAWFKCGTHIQTAGQSVCTIYTPSGPRYRSWNYRRLYDVSGGRCGYLGLVVTCFW